MAQQATSGWQGQFNLPRSCCSCHGKWLQKQPLPGGPLTIINRKPPFENIGHYYRAKFNKLRSLLINMTMNSNKYCVEKTSVISSSPEQIFKVLADVIHWNQWTKSVLDISFVEHDTLKVGAKIKVLQAKLPPAIWTITEISENKSLTWEKRSFGLRMIANHTIQESNEGAFVKLQIIYQRFMARFFYKLSSVLTNKYMTMEITGLKQKCEKG